jgi:predicted dehydrogenase
MSTPKITRRNFTKTLVAAGAAFSAAPAFLRGQNLNDKLNIAVIACGGRGGSNLQSVSSENIVALCDVNEKNLAAAAAKHPGAKKFADYRKLFDAAAADFDAVVVSTCEHTHAFATMLALKAGKHVYCEKPLTHGIWECRQIRHAAAAARANGKAVATQMGTQIHAGDNYRRVVELVQSGIVGPIKECHVWVGRAWGLQSEADAKKNKDIVFVTDRPKEAQTPPPFLDWDLWLGPAPQRPYNDVYFPGPKWYRWWDFGSGTMSDLGSHWNDLPFWALKLTAPQTIEAFGAPAHPEIAPASMSATYQYGPRGDMPAVKLSWYQGDHKPEIWKGGGIPKWSSGCLFIGDKGMILSDYDKHLLLPEKDFKDATLPPKSIPKSIGHHEEWINACKTGAPTTCNFEYSGQLTEANHLANVAYRLGKKIEWDAENLKCTNAPEAERIIHREYRKGWAL